MTVVPESIAFQAPLTRSSKLTWEKPELLTHGSVVELTLPGKNNLAQDGASQNGSKL